MKKLIFFFILVLTGCDSILLDFDYTPNSSNSNQTHNSTNAAINSLTPTITDENKVTQTLDLNWWDSEGAIAYFNVDDQGSHIYLSGVETHPPVLITGNFKWAGPPEWSPDGESIAFISWEWSYNNLYVIDISTQKLRQVTDDSSSWIRRFEWAPDSSKIAYYDDVNFQVVDVISNESMQLLSLDPEVGLFRWSPDGSSIIFDYGPETQEVFYRYSLLNDTLIQISTTPSNIGEFDLSPSGNQLVFTESRVNNDGSDLYVLDLASGEKIRLTDSSSYKFSPVWSPDGSKILFEFRWPDEHIDLYLIDPNGENLTQLTNFVGNEWYADWSNDGNRILFENSIESLEEELELGKRDMGPAGIWIYDFTNNSFIYLLGTENGRIAKWRP
jgi:Tol biopolymer transport system component